MKALQWSVSGLRVTARPEDLTALQSMLSGRPGVTVEACDPAGGQLVVTQEFTTVRQHQDGLREIQALPGVLTADLVIHYRDPGAPSDERSTGGS
jgi:nitrate reductase NapAB chaperone NapD